jgi:hypothetical protein
MKRLPLFKLYFTPILFLLFLSSCKKEFESDNYVAYFGGEVLNPANRYVLLCKNNKVIDSIKLKEDNTFFKKFDSLTPGMYTFKHEPEYQYIYFDKNDSLMVHINSKNFDESIVFCGRGDDKNNFLMELYLKNEKDKDAMFEVFGEDFNQFNTKINKLYSSNKKYFDSKKNEINWTEDFDMYAEAALVFPYNTKKEIYPLIHKMRTGKDIYEKLPKDYYNFRKDVDFSNEKLIDYSPYVMYITHMIDNVSEIKYHNHFSTLDLSLKTNINKLKVTDTLIKSEKLKNSVLNNIAFKYLLEDQNMSNNNSFLDTYHKYSTDKSQKNEIIKIGNAIQLLKPNFELPKVTFIDIHGKNISSDDLMETKTVFFFWTTSADSHMKLVHKKVLELKKKYPQYHFIGVNINDKESKWRTTLFSNKLNILKQYHCVDFEDLREKWAITKIHRTIVVNKDKKIINAFTNIFDVNFEENLK